MKKIIALLAFIAFTHICLANEQNPLDDFLISKDAKSKMNARDAKEGAGKILDSKPQAIEIDTRKLPKRTLRKQQNVKETEAKKLAYGEAPFGLLWGASIAEIENMGVKLEPLEKKDYANNFNATFLPKPLEDFAFVDLTFGKQNMLWRINSYSHEIGDDEAASKAMFLYRKYYKLLKQKYGNVKQFYTPKITRIEKTVEEGGKKRVEVIETKHEIGNDNFLAELQSGEAVLFSVFENENVGAALSVNVDENGKSSIIIDYKNLKLIENQDKKTLDAL